MARGASTDTSLQVFLTALFERSSRRSLIELRWPADDGMYRSFHALDGLNDIDLHVARLARSHDVYFGVLPRWRWAGRRRDLTGAPRVVWADCDGSAAASALGSFEPRPSLVLRSGSGENRHAFWLLSRAETLARVEQANRRLAAMLGADDGVVTSPIAILRLPGTFNHKHSPPVPVTLEVCEPGRRYRLEQILRRLPTEQHSSSSRRQDGRRRRTGDDPLLALSPEFYVWRLTGRRPGRSRKIHCPLHDDRRASFHVYLEPHRGWYCYGCRHGGSAIDLAAALWRRPTRGSEFIALREELERLLL
jgi:hypothetical protein